jgi:hypothetical protein
VCTGACLLNACGADGELIQVTIIGTQSDLLWGTAVFTDDSDVGAAAVHSGEVTVGQVKQVTALCTGEQASFTGSESNGITSRSYNQAWGKSFSFDLGGRTPNPNPPAPQRCFQEPCSLAKCRVQGTSFDIIVTGSRAGGVWGSEIFTDDSSVGLRRGHAQRGDDERVRVLGVLLQLARGHAHCPAAAGRDGVPRRVPQGDVRERPDAPHLGHWRHVWLRLGIRQLHRRFDGWAGRRSRWRRRRG